MVFLECLSELLLIGTMLEIAGILLEDEIAMPDFPRFDDLDQARLFPVGAPPVDRMQSVPEVL